MNNLARSQRPDVEASRAAAARMPNARAVGSTRSRVNRARAVYRQAMAHRRRHRTRTALRFLRVSVVVNYLFAAAKLVAGILAASLPVIATAFFNTGIGAAKQQCLRRHRQHRTRQKKMDLYSPYRVGGTMVIVASSVYLGFTLWSAFGSYVTRYPAPLAILIAAVSFTEIVIAIHGSFSRSLSDAPLMRANKLVNLASGCIAIALTQTAILSFTTTGDHTRENALGASVLGTIALLIGVWMLLYPGIVRRRPGNTPLAQHKPHEAT